MTNVIITELVTYAGMVLMLAGGIMFVAGVRMLYLELKNKKTSTDTD